MKNNVLYFTLLIVTNALIGIGSVDANSKTGVDSAFATSSDADKFSSELEKNMKINQLNSDLIELVKKNGTLTKSNTEKTKTKPNAKGVADKTTKPPLTKKEESKAKKKANPKDPRVKRKPEITEEEKLKERKKQELLKKLEKEIESEQKKKENERVKDPSNIMDLPPLKWSKLYLNKKSRNPFQRKGHTAVIADSFMVVFGGCYMDRKCFNDVYFLDLRTNTWLEVPTYGIKPGPRGGHSAILHGTTMWIFGGFSLNTYLNELYSLNLETREWTQHYFSGDAPSGRTNHGAALYETKIIIFGGYTEKGYDNSLYIIDLENGKFEQPKTLGKGPSPRENFVFNLVNNRLWMFGGYQEGSALNDFYSIDLFTWTWIEVQSNGIIPSARHGSSSVRVGNKIYIFSGCDYKLNKCYADGYYFDTESMWWTKLPDLTPKEQYFGRQEDTAVIYRGFLYRFGGCQILNWCYNNVRVMKLEKLCHNTCSGNGECKKIIGCVCNPGFTEHDCSVKIKCKKDCNNNGMCHNNGRCGCFPGWAGNVCDVKIPCRNNCTSSVNGICQRDRKCKCNENFAGEDCSIFKGKRNTTEEFQSLLQMGEKQKLEKTNCKNDCSGNGSCNPRTKICSCKDAFIGEDCSINILSSINLTEFKKQFLRSEETPKSVKSVKQQSQTEPEHTKDKHMSHNHLKGPKSNNTVSQLYKNHSASNSTTTDNKDSTEKKKNETKSKIYVVLTEEERLIHESDLLPCPNDCNKNGKCIRGVCKCNHGFISQDCSIKEQDYFDFQKMLILSGIGIIILVVISVLIKLSFTK